MSKINKSCILKYSKELTSSLLFSLENSTKNIINLQSDTIDLDYLNNDVNLRLSCKIIIDSDYYKSSDICDFVPLYFEQFIIKNKLDEEIYFKQKYESKYRNLTKAQVKYLAYSDQLIIKENMKQRLYGMEDNYVTLLGDKTMYNKELLFKKIQTNVYNTIKSRIKKVLK